MSDEREQAIEAAAEHNWVLEYTADGLDHWECLDCEATETTEAQP